MTAIEKLTFAITSFSKMNTEEFQLSLPFWQERTFKKGEFYNERSHICKNLGFIIEGTFRGYIIEEKTGEEKNVFLYSSDQFVVSFKSFINQVPCDYYTQSMTDSTILYINIIDLLALYQQSHQWERFGRLLAQEAFNVAMDRSESFLFKTPEERYLNLIKHHPDIFNTVPLYHISSYLGIQGPSLSRIRKRLSGK
ncbi:Crp/Fnr family transcriptional regulator [uncultured Fluviicola sp.]|uniref:Crp/Fnr family transcriptional regulator n=1 Tax=uncultured Fluviicola sp. TaxID=463303 RepID=UPI0025E44002|nr:Crp/Fnr family transcriptional regulator [uncultured Fluviicola sp.]